MRVNSRLKKDTTGLLATVQEMRAMAAAQPDVFERIDIHYRKARSCSAGGVKAGIHRQRCGLVASD